MTLSVKRVGWYLIAGAAVILGALAFQTSLLAGLLFIAAGSIALPDIRDELRARGTNISSWLAITLVVTGAVSGLIVIGMTTTETPASTPGATTSAPTDAQDAPSFSLSANDTQRSNPLDTLHITWIGDARQSVDPQPDDGYTYEADAGQQYVVLRLNITNAGERAVDLDPGYYRLLVDGVEYSPNNLARGDSMRDVTLRPGASYKTHLTFQIPEEADGAELITDNEAYYDTYVAANFTRDPGLTVQYGQ